jgi:choice-of-anchor C domain-containing protein
MRTKKISVLLCGLIVSFWSLGVANADLFQNGSFESPGSSAAFVTMGFNNTSITGWRVSNSNIDYVSYWTDSDGTMAIDLNGTSAGGIEQTFDTIPNQWYEVLFDMAGNPANQSQIEYNLKTMVVSASNNPESSYSFNTTGHTSSNMGWTTFSYVFQAYDTTTTLSFLSTSEAGQLAVGPALDNVRVTPISSPVPLPPTMLLFGSGLLGLVCLRRFRKG